MRILFFIGIVTVLGAQSVEKPVNVQITGHIVRPAAVEPTDARVSGLSLAPGFRIQKFADNLGNPRMIAVADDGSVYVARKKEGDCLLLRDSDRDGKADMQQVVAKKEDLHGVTVHENRVYLVTVKEVLVADRNQDGTLGSLKTLVRDLPDGGQHPNRTIFFGPDNRMYVTVGSTCNACEEPNKEHATILVFNADGSGRKIFAQGLRNTLGIDWHPETRELWGMDHGTDWLGDQAQKEELNRIEEGKSYGWPHLYEDNQPYVRLDPPNGKTWSELASQNAAPALLYTAHAAPMQFFFYRGNQFPAEYRGDAFVTMRGSWNRRPPSGFEVVRVRFQNGKPAKFEPFVTGFVLQENGEWRHFGRPVGLAFTPDGAMLIGDDTQGVIYQVSHESASQTRTRTGAGQR